MQAVRYKDMTIEEGAWYRTQNGTRTEYACVLRVQQDKMGIPHVHYELQVQRVGTVPTTEQRTLALASFRQRYQERIRGS